MFEAKLANASLLKRIIDAIKDLVTDAPFDCSEAAVSLQGMDSAHVALVSLKMNSGLFDFYRCDRSVNLGISLNTMSKAFRCANVDDECIIRYVEDDGDSVMFSFADPKKEKNQDVSIKLIDIDSEYLSVPDQDEMVICEMPAHEFQKTCKDLATFSETININAAKGIITFTGEGETGQALVVKYKSYGDIDDCKSVFIEINDTVNVNFSARYLNQFAKASSLSDRVRLTICNDVPIVIQYTIPEDHGYLRFYLAPKMDDDDDDTEVSNAPSLH